MCVRATGACVCVCCLPVCCCLFVVVLDVTLCAFSGGYCESPLASRAEDGDTYDLNMEFVKRDRRK